MESGLPHKSDFDRSCYDTVIQALDPDYILGNLKDRFGADLDEPYYHHGDESSLSLRIAHQFAYVHSGVKAEQQAEEQQGDQQHEPDN
jgi:hypothetical protein